MPAPTITLAAIAIKPKSKAATCLCSAYDFPHREGSGVCAGNGWCDMCGAGLEWNDCRCPECSFSPDDAWRVG